MKKCKNCGVDVPPVFASALMGNKCPACGKEIMTGADFKEMRAFCRNLAGLGLDEKLVVTISAALSEKFDLVPKGKAGEVPHASATTVEPEVAPKIQDKFAHIDEMLDEQKIRDKLFKEAQQARDAESEAAEAADWGLQETSDAKVAALRAKAKAPPPPEFIDMVSDLLPQYDPNDIPPEAFASGNNPLLQSDRMARMAKRDAAKMSGMHKTIMKHGAD